MTRLLMVMSDISRKVLGFELKKERLVRGKSDSPDRGRWDSSPVDDRCG
jgi:hypothetical protein